MKRFGLTLILLSFSFGIAKADLIDDALRSQYDAENIPKVFRRVHNDDMTVDTSKKSLCQMTSEDFMALAGSEDNMMAVPNERGVLGTGVCWWHSRLQRSSFYLAVFDRADDPKPSQREVLKILRDIYYRNKVVHIPGFKNWNEFTSQYYGLVVEALSSYEMSGIANFEFIKGIRLNTGDNRAALNDIYSEVVDKKRISFLLQKRNGLIAHALLVPGVFDMPGSNKPVHGPELNLALIDSENPTRVTFLNPARNEYIYQVGGTYLALRYPTDRLVNFDAEPITLEVQNQNDYADFIRAIERECGSPTPFTRFQKVIGK